MVLFYVCLVEIVFCEVSFGVLEVVDVMGVSYWEIIWKVLIFESIFVLIFGLIVIMILMIGFIVMVGVIGVGGFGGFVW